MHLSKSWTKTVTLFLLCSSLLPSACQKKKSSDNPEKEKVAPGIVDIKMPAAPADKGPRRKSRKEIIDEFLAFHRELAEICLNPTLSKNENPKTEFEYPETGFSNLADVRKSWYEFRATCIAEYNKYSDASAEKKKLVQEFLQRNLRHGLVHDDNWRDILQLALKCIDQENLKDEDPLLLGHAAIAAMHIGEGELAEKFFLQAIRSFPKHHYSSRHVCRITAGYVELIHYTDNPSGTSRVAEIVGNSFHYWLTKDLKATPREHCLVVFEIVDALRSVYHPSHVRRSETMPMPGSTNIKFFLEPEGMPLWIREMVQGLRAFNDAWVVRGPTFASDVMPRRMQEFYRVLKASSVHFERALELAPCFSIPAEYLIAASLGDSDQMMSWFSKAYEIQVDGGRALHRLIHYFRPRWGGTPEEMRSLAARVEQIGDPESANGYAFITMFQYMMMDQNMSFFSDKELIRKTIKSLDEMIAVRDENSWDFTSTQLENIRLMVMIGAELESQEIVAAAEKLGDRISRMAMISFGHSFDPDFHVALHRAKTNEKVDQEKNNAVKNCINVFFITEEQFEELEPFVKEQLASGDAREQVFWRFALARIRLIKGFHDGDWTSLDMDNWKNDWGQLDEEFCDYSRRNEIQMSCGVGRTRYTRFNGQLDNYIAVEFELKFDSDYGQRSCSGFEVGTASGVNFGVAFNHRPGALALQKTGNQPEEYQHFVSNDIKKTNKVRILTYEGRMEIYINDKFQRCWANDGIRNIIHIGFKNNLAGQGCLRTTISNVRMKKLSGNPVPDDAFNKVDYFTSIIDELEHSNAWVQKAKALLTMTKVDDAVKALDQAEQLGHGSEEIAFYRSLIQIQQGDWKGALAVLEPVADSDLRLPERYTTLRMSQDYRSEDSLFILALIMFFSPDESVMDEQVYRKIIDKFKNSESGHARCQQQLIFALKNHRDGKYEKARAFLGFALTAATPEFRSIIERQYKPILEKDSPFVLSKGLMIYDYLLINRAAKIDGLGAWEF